MKVKSVHLVVFVFLLPLSVAGLADSDPTLAHFIAVRTPHVNGVINREGTSSHRLVGEVLTVSNTAGQFALLLFGGAFFLILAGVLLVLARLCFESHDLGL